MFRITAKTYWDARKYGAKWGLTDSQVKELEDLLDSHFSRGLNRGLDHVKFKELKDFADAGYKSDTCDCPFYHTGPCDNPTNVRH